MASKNSTLVRRAALFALCALALSACGGGGSESDSFASDQGDQETPTIPAMPGGGTVEAQFVPIAGQARYILLGSGGGFGTGVLGNAQQGQSGSYINLGDYQADPGALIVDVAGNENYARGSWVGSTYTVGGKSIANQGGLYYAVYNSPTSLPVAAAPVCQGHFGSTRDGSGNPGTVSGTATLTITDSVAQVNVALKVMTAGLEIPLSATTQFDNKGFGLSVGKLLSGQSGVGIALGQAGEGFVVVAPFKAYASSSLFQGVVVFTCK